MEWKHAPRAEWTSYLDIPVVRLSCGPYEADICPVLGANCIRFARNGVNVMRTPAGMAEFRARPNVYGTPLLFPPNRIGGGVFFFRERAYLFPINEPQRGHHIHGLLSSMPFSPAEAGADAQSAFASFRVAFDDHAPYLDFPHAFSVTLSYRLDTAGLAQALTVENLGGGEMPCGLGFHTALAVPFLPGTGEEEYRLYATVGDEILLDPASILPTGETLANSPVGNALRSGLLPPADAPLSNHFRGRAGEIRLVHTISGAAVRYLPDPRFSFLMLWNGGGRAGFVCPEPQTWQVDAPNSPLPPEISGFRTLEPGESLCLDSRFAIDLGSFPESAL